ncbi:MAG: dTDP-4-dehydrorhamnose reductase [ANME-2 cluster archaeon]|nr:MAG: dTDP-4-dehydrorhamnose reductase [ANME-2 cluster archaeon]
MVVGKIKKLILGANGQLGFDLCNVFSNSIQLTHSDLDITNNDKVIETIKKIKPDIVINAAAYTDVDGCENNKELALKVNGIAPGNIAKACKFVGAKLIHYSTDYIFDGAKTEYVESDQANPINVYGQSKYIGEKNIIENMDDYLIIRTSWLFGIQSRNFVKTMLKLSSQMDTVKVVNDQYGKPTYTHDLALRTTDMVDLAPGIYHITNDGICSWYEFAKEIIDNVAPCTSEDFVRKARRPKYSVLVNTKTNPLRHWKEALADYLNSTKMVNN